jgi:hypothetical protein
MQRKDKASVEAASGPWSTAGAGRRCCGPRRGRGRCAGQVHPVAVVARSRECRSPDASVPPSPTSVSRKVTPAHGQWGLGRRARSPVTSRRVAPHGRPWVAPYGGPCLAPFGRPEMAQLARPRWLSMGRLLTSWSPRGLLGSRPWGAPGMPGRPGGRAARGQEPNRVLRGWANYSAYGTRLMAYRAVDHYVYERARQFLRRWHKVSTPSGPPSRELRRVGCPSRRLGSYWGAPTPPQAGLAPARVQHPSRRVAKHNRCRVRCLLTVLTPTSP